MGKGDIDHNRTENGDEDYDNYSLCNSILLSEGRRYKIDKSTHEKSITQIDVVK